MFFLAPSINTLCNENVGRKFDKKGFLGVGILSPPFASRQKNDDVCS